MIKSITVTNYLGDKLKLELTRPERSGFAVKSITGLGPGKANISTSEMSTTDGGLYNSSRLPVRNIVLSLEFLWGSSIEDTRQKSYRYFPIKRQVTLLLETDNRMVEISGYVESNEPTIFSKNEGSEISIICPDPYFYSVGEKGIISTEFYGTESLFEFPFSNESLTDSLIEMGSISQITERTLVYEGDTDIGIVITINATGEANNVSIIHRVGSSMGVMRIDTEKLKLSTGSIIKAGDQIIISTMKGNKYIKLIRDGETKSILNCLDRNVEWFQLVRGENVFTYTADGVGVHNLNISIKSQVRYEGV